MSDIILDDTRPADPVGRVLFFSSYGLAVVGGVAMIAMAVMVVVSVTGRYLFSAPIYGDFEMVAMGTAMAVALFLPYCHLKKGNVVVDLFASWLPGRTQIFLDAFAGLLFGAISAMLTWRVYDGMLDAYSSGETTMILGLTIWWAYPFLIAAFALLTLTCLYTAVKDLKEALS